MDKDRILQLMDLWISMINQRMTREESCLMKFHMMKKILNKTHMESIDYNHSSQ